MNKNIDKSKIGFLLNSAFDFLFPTNPDVKKLQETPAQILLEQMPASEPVSGTFAGTTNTLSITTLFAYADERVKNLVWEIKYYKNQKISDSVGELLAEKIRHGVSQSKGSAVFTKNYLVIPVPLTKKRLRERGFNHTEMLATSIMKHLPQNFTLVTNILEKIRHTPKQSSLEDRAQRLENLIGAFRVSNAVAIQNKHIILIDDVVTTGATVREISTVLSNAGANSVAVFAIAH
jgi:ComF family protein